MVQSIQIFILLKKINQGLEQEGLRGEIYLVGGAVMCIALNARQSTQDIDAIFEPKSKIRKIVDKIAQSEALPRGWLNDAVKDYLSSQADFKPFLELSNLQILTASPEYLLAMKCLAMRIGEEFHDEDDVRFLLRYLNLEKYDEAIKVIEKYYPLDRFPQKSFYTLEEILNERKN